MKNSNYLSKQNLAELLGISLATVNRHMKEGKLSFIKLGRRVFFDPKQIQEDMQALQTFSEQTNL